MLAILEIGVAFVENHGFVMLTPIIVGHAEIAQVKVGICACYVEFRIVT